MYLNTLDPSDRLLQSHTSTTLAHEFTKVLEDFGVADKVSTFLFNKDEHLPLKDLERDMRQCIHE